MASAGVRWRIIRMPLVGALMRTRRRLRRFRVILGIVIVVVLRQSEGGHDQEHKNHGPEPQSVFSLLFQNHRNLLNRKSFIHLLRHPTRTALWNPSSPKSMASICDRRRRRTSATTERPRKLHAHHSAHQETNSRRGKKVPREGYGRSQRPVKQVCRLRKLEPAGCDRRRGNVNRKGRGLEAQSLLLLLAAHAIVRGSKPTQPSGPRWTSTQACVSRIFCLCRAEPVPCCSGE